MVARIAEGHQGYVLIELLAALTVLAALMISTAAELRSQSCELRALYEERVARGVAVNQAELLEASGKGGRAEGRSEIQVKDPGWENLPRAVCAVELAGLEPGLWRAQVRVSWQDPRGWTRQVEVATLLRE